MSTFQPIEDGLSLVQQELRMLEFWQKNQVFEQSLKQNAASPTKFFFYDGPPFATGLPHYGHILAGTVKDVIPRYQTMLGKYVERRFGWDCHGLPVEFEAEKELKLSGKKDIDQMGVAKFNEYCRSIVLRYADEWRSIVNRMGRWVDLDNDYKTMDLNFMESIWWVFSELWRQGLIYQKMRIVPYSARLNTPLSNFEVSLAYKSVQDPSVTVMFKQQGLAAGSNPRYFLAWTTTPWTLPANLGLAVSPTQSYVCVEQAGKEYWLAEDALQYYFKAKTKTKAKDTAKAKAKDTATAKAKDTATFKIINHCLGEELVGLNYEPLWPDFAHFAQQGAFKVLAGDFVTSESGTAIVHIAPMFGEDDFQLGEKNALPELLPMNNSGEFLADVSEVGGLYFKDADPKVIQYLKSKGQLFLHETITHNYPFCWRSDTPLMYRAIPSWYVRVEQIKEQLIRNNQKINWAPDHIGAGRMGNWLSGARDWSISRNRYWGTPIPVWICQNCQAELCIGSCQQLSELSGQKITDLHIHKIDHLRLPCEKCGTNSMQRTPEVLDCWFESGAMPYGQQHYPFENKEQFEQTFPADFISEGLDQTRGWFYTLNILSTALFNQPAAKNIVVTGMVLAQDGKKMSKSLKNYPDPNQMIQAYGADAIRLYMLNSGAIKAEELRFAESGLQGVYRKILLPLHNALNFFLLYVSADKLKLAAMQTGLKPATHLLDRWVMAKLQQLNLAMRAALDNYDLQGAVQPLVTFIDRLTNWYIRRSRRRFWKATDVEDKLAAYQTLYQVLLTLSQLTAPFMPFLAEAMYQRLRQASAPQSVHLCSFPTVQTQFLDPHLDNQMEQVLSVVNLGHSLRAKHQVKTRQPLPELVVISQQADWETTFTRPEMRQLVVDELNVKHLKFTKDESAYVTYQARPNLPKLGPKFGAKLGVLKAAIQKLTPTEVSAINQGQTLELQLAGTAVSLSAADLLIDRKGQDQFASAVDSQVTVVLDTEIGRDELLQEEGLARDFVRAVQGLRKQQALNVSDRILITYVAPQDLQTALENHQEYIQQETLANVLKTVEHNVGLTKIEKLECWFNIEKV